MPPKRRLSGAEEEEGEGGAASTTPEPGKKKRKLDPLEQMKAVLEFVRKYKKEDGAELCGAMTRLPNKRSEPGYYEVVDNPIDVIKIQQKLKTDEYANMEELRADFDLVVANTKLFYKRGTAEHRDASELGELVGRVVEAVVGGEDPATVVMERGEREITEFLEELFGTVMSINDPAEPSRALNIVFQLLPSRKRYPEYYDDISEPMDLKTVAEKIQRGKYQDIQEMEKDLQLIFSNARSFNEPGSQIYKDAGVLGKVVKNKAADCTASLTAKQNRGSKSSRRVSRVAHSAAIAALQYEESESEEEEDSESEQALEAEEGPQWKLFNAVRTFTTERGLEIAEAFLTLPSKRELPDYYQAIERPICLTNIKKKIRQGSYPALEDVAEDFNLMFANCREYNRQESKLWRDGAKLHKVMQARLAELLDGDVDATAMEAMEAVRKSPKDPKEALRKRLRSLFNSIYYWANAEGIQPIGVFLEKPSRKDYPDYYDIITEPIDMNMIDARIKGAHYRTEEELLADCKLMFSNCRLYNEEGSGIYEDANVLERVLLAKAKELGVFGGGERRRARKVVSLPQKIKTLYETLKDYRDAKGRQLSLIFLKLPSKHEYPDYYDIIKRPIDLEKISSKIRNGQYDTLEEAVADFSLVFDNAAKYNEPDSQIYKDAQTLARLAQQTVRHLTEDIDGIPDTRAAVGDILMSIYTAVFTAQDSEDRTLSDSLGEVAEHDEVGGKKVRALSLEIVKRRVDRGLYKRLDLLQRDVLQVLERARRLSRTDSQAWEDAVELSRRWVKARDLHTEQGGRLQSRATEYTMDMLEKEVAEAKERKRNTEERGEEVEGVEMEEGGTSAWSGLGTDGAQYHVGDFVYVSAAEGGDPHIYMVERMFEKEGAKAIWGGQFFRQRETFHVPTRTFYEKEVMKGDLHEAIPISKVLGKCYVLPVRDYFRHKPQGLEERDVYVCEWKYTSKQRNWKKIKPTGFWDAPEHIRIVAREKALEPRRVPSVFKDRIEKHKEEIEELEVLEKTVEEEVPGNLKWVKEGEADGLQYWEQYTIPGPITLRRGDHVLVRGENNRNMVAQIDTMWTGQDGMAYFHGPWFVTPQEIPPQIGRPFYKAEAFLSSISDSNPLLSVVGKCCVLGVSHYSSRRHTQYAEADVYVCESMFDEGKRLILPLVGGAMKQYLRGPKAARDEVFLFRSRITLEKEHLAAQRNVSSPMLDNEDSMDAPPSVGSVNSSETPNRKKFDRKKLITAYILFSADVRKITMDENPGVKFGEISRIVAERWRGMSDADKQAYAERAKKVNEDKEKEEARREAERLRWEEERRRNPPPAAASPGPQHNGGPASPLGRARQESGGGGGGARQEPLFHSVPPRPQRLLHSEAYIKYIEGLNKESRSMCNWDRQLNASSEVTRVPDEAKLPVSWLAGNTGEHATSVDVSDAILATIRTVILHTTLLSIHSITATGHGITHFK